MKGLISFHYQSPSRLPKDKVKLKSFIVSIFKKEKTRMSSILFVFCTDEYLHAMNKLHLNHDDYTDVITFFYSSPGEPVESEAYISLDRVRDNATQFKSTITHELHRVIFHSVLHLCGYNDKKPDEKSEMRDREDHYLKLYFD
jgi:probable rRNA maturation factor